MTTLTTTEDFFDPSWVNEVVRIEGAGTAGATHESVIDAYTDPRTVTIHDAAATTVGPTARIVVGKMVGIGIQGGFSPNVKDIRIESVLVYRALYGIDILSGHYFVNGVRGGTNEIDVRVTSSSGEPFRIWNINTENSRQHIYASTVANLDIQYCRGANLLELSEGSIEIGHGVISLKLRNNTFETPPPGASALVNLTNADSLNSLQVDGNEWPPAQVTLAQAISGNAIQNVDGGYIGPEINISDLHGVMELGYYNTSVLKGNTVAHILAIGSPRDGSFTYATDGTPGSNPLAGSGTGSYAYAKGGTWIAFT